MDGCGRISVVTTRRQHRNSSQVKATDARHVIYTAVCRYITDDCHGVHE